MRRITVLLLVLALGGSVPAEEAQSPLVVAYIADSVDHLAGRAVMEEAYRRLEVPVEFRGFRADEALEASNGGKVGAELMRIDGIHLRFTGLEQVPIPINYQQIAAFSKTYRFPILGWHSLRPYKIGIVEGVLVAERGTRGMEVRAAASYTELIEWIHDGEVDVGVMPRISGLVALHDSERADVQEMKGVLETMLSYHYLHRSRADLRPRLSKVLKEMLLDGTTKKLRSEAYAKLLGGRR